MQLLFAIGIVLLILITAVYILTQKSGVYADKIEINVFKLLSIKISNKVKGPGRPSNHPEHTDA